MTTRGRSSLVDFTVLLLLDEMGEASGASLDTVVEARGYRAWAGIGASSIYARLRTLEKHGLLTSCLQEHAHGRGPAPRLFTLTEAGTRALHDRIAVGLSSTREHDPAFNLALSGLDRIPGEQAVQHLRARRAFLQREKLRLTAASTGALPLTARLLFDRILNGLSAEIHWLDTVELEDH